VEALHHPLSVDAPVAVLEKQRVLVASEAATALGIKPGMGTATARALADDLLLLERDADAEARCLDQLCCWAYSVTPTLYPWRENCLLLEIGSCLKLYGGLEAVLARVREDLARRGYSYQYGLGPTPKSAWLFSIKPLESHATDSREEALYHRQGSVSGPPRGIVSDSGGDALSLEEKLAPLPLRLLQDFPREVDALAKAGLWTFGDILALPRRALARRCGKAFILHLEQVLGTAEDRCQEFQPPREFSDHYWFGYEVKANQELLPAIELLLQALCRFLRNTQLETRQVAWLLYGIDRKIYRIEVFSSLPQTSWSAWYELTRLKVEQLELSEGLEGVGLASRSLVPGSAASGDLFQDRGQKEPLHGLLDRLKSRLGLQSVTRIATRDEHLPEFAGYCSLDTRPANVPLENGELRPFWLMQEPERLNEFNGQPCWKGRLELLDGPERIEDNWWDRPASRDYYIARDGSGQLYWIYRDRLDNHWYLQGIFH
jgi:protein ImuB